MDRGLYTIKDELSKWTEPITFYNDEYALRAFMQYLHNDPMRETNNKDYSIWKIGKFDLETGTIELVKPEMLKRGL